MEHMMRQELKYYKNADADVHYTRVKERITAVAGQL